MSVYRAAMANSNTVTHASLKCCTQTPPISVVTIRRSCVYNTWRSQRWQHAMKPDIGREWWFLPTQPAFDSPVRGSRRNIAITFGTEKLQIFGYPIMKKIEDMLTRLDRIHERHRQEDGQTDTAWRHSPRLCTASRDKNIVSQRAHPRSLNAKLRAQSSHGPLQATLSNIDQLSLLSPVGQKMGSRVPEWVKGWRTSRTDEVDGMFTCCTAGPVVPRYH